MLKAVLAAASDLVEQTALGLLVDVVVSSRSLVVVGEVVDTREKEFAEFLTGIVDSLLVLVQSGVCQNFEKVMLLLRLRVKRE